jgi:serine protease AprX
MFQYIILLLLVLTTLNAQQLSPLVGIAPLGIKLENKYNNITPTEQIKVWIYFTDKGALGKQTQLNANSMLTAKAIARRAKVIGINKLVDSRDLPVPQNYVDKIADKVINIKQKSKWFNAVSANVTKDQIDNLRTLPFVKKIEIVATYGKAKPEIKADVNNELLKFVLADSLNYGTGRKQVDQINVIPLHNRGIRGQGVTVAVIDNGFRLLTHEAFATMNIVAKYDFVDNDPNPEIVPAGAGAHGVNTLSTIGGYKAGQLIGPAYQANFIIARTEDDFSETPLEEDNWVRAIEWAESLGVDVTSTSLGYLTYDAPYTSWTWQNMDGNTTVITKAGNRADSLGVIVVNSAGNEGTVGTPNTLAAPADGFNVITAGAVDSFGVRTGFSSYGPTFDGRIKPDVMAMGTGVKVASSSATNVYARTSGTSFSCPLTAGVAALVLSAHPSLTNTQVREAMKSTASRSGSPDNYYGCGILNATAAADVFKPNINHTPISSAQLNSSIIIVATITGVIPIKLDSCKVVYGINGAFDNSANLTPTGNPNEYSAIIPPLGNGNLVNYYFSIQDTDKDVVISPTNAPTGFYYYTIGSQKLSAGWNLVSIPYALSDYQASTIYSAASSQTYGYQNGYTTQTTLQNGKGYWVKYGSVQSIEFSGSPRLNDTINVTAGWNLIGGLSSPVAIGSIIQEPGDIISAPLYYFNIDHYDAATYIEPGKGYWVKLSQDGRLILNASGKK